MLFISQVYLFEVLYLSECSDKYAEAGDLIVKENAFTALIKDISPQFTEGLPLFHAIFHRGSGNQSWYCT